MQELGIDPNDLAGFKLKADPMLAKTIIQFDYRIVGSNLWARIIAKPLIATKLINDAKA